MIDRMGTGVYLGRDFALGEKKDKWCRIHDDSEEFGFTFVEPVSNLDGYDRCAVNCLFGMPMGFAVKRIRDSGAAIPDPCLDAVSAHKHKENGTDNRREVYEFLRSRSQSWCSRVLAKEAPNCLIDSDDPLDAWLAALNAWAHTEGETIRWNDVEKDAGLTDEIVSVEGHISILDQEKHSN
jgi:hypothetical protein